ncbi:hypothetical protein C1H76_2155 [Elsinoe australis]|uniref:Uncharacterized protein n=1 Tax=Elsinoe australis TaxID=40998 RepID=A0A4U7B6U4_9PEZI|nr:hypothetical protein C1H76_2155 [Elsinoe australis]
MKLNPRTSSKARVHGHRESLSRLSTKYGVKKIQRPKRGRKPCSKSFERHVYRCFQRLESRGQCLLECNEILDRDANDLLDAINIKLSRMISQHEVDVNAAGWKDFVKCFGRPIRPGRQNIPFFDLPLELRQMVYNSVEFLDNRRRSSDRHTPRLIYIDLELSVWKPSAFFCTSKCIRKEIIAFFESRFTMYMPAIINMTQTEDRYPQISMDITKRQRSILSTPATAPVEFSIFDCRIYEIGTQHRDAIFVIKSQGFLSVGRSCYGLHAARCAACCRNWQAILAEAEREMSSSIYRRSGSGISMFEILQLVDILNRHFG